MAQLPVAVGSTFSMTTFGDNIEGAFYVVEPYQYFGGQSYYPGLDVMHNWELEEVDGQTILTDEEEMQGDYAEKNQQTILANLKKSKTEWLAYLKTEAEKNN